MKALKKIAKYMRKHPDSPDCRILSRLINDVDNNGQFPLNDLYELDYENFELALGLLKEWRLDRFLKTKGRLRDLAQQLAAEAEVPPRT